MLDSLLPWNMGEKTEETQLTLTLFVFHEASKHPEHNKANHRSVVGPDIAALSFRRRWE